VATFRGWNALSDMDAVAVVLVMLDECAVACLKAGTVC